MFVGTKVQQQPITCPNENTPYLGSVKFDFLGLIITVLAGKPQGEKHTYKTGSTGG